MTGGSLAGDIFRPAELAASHYRKRTLIGKHHSARKCQYPCESVWQRLPPKL